MPCLLEQATRAFFYKGADWEQRTKLIRDHVAALQQKMTPEFLRQIYVRHGRVNLWTDKFQEKPLTLDLLFHPGQRKEGCLSLVLHWGGPGFLPDHVLAGTLPGNREDLLLGGGPPGYQPGE